MALVLKDRVRETTSTTGTGTLSLAGPYSSFQPFSLIGNGNTTYYAIADASTGEWEVGIGTYTTSGNTLSRDTVLASSNAGSLVNLSVGIKDVICTQPAERAVYVVGADVVASNSAKVPNTLLANSAVTVNGSAISLGDAATVTATATNALTIGTGLSGTSYDGSSAVTVAIDSTVATLAGSQVLTNKTLSVDDNAVSGIAASSFVLSNASGNIDGAAAQKAIPAGAVVGSSDTQTLTNKRVTPRIGTVADAATITPTADSSDQYNVTALAQTATVAAPSGTPTDGQKLIIRLRDDGTGRNLTWTTTTGAYRAIGVTLPTTTVAGKTTYVGCVYNSAASFWDVVAVATQA